MRRTLTAASVLEALALTIFACFPVMAQSTWPGMGETLRRAYSQGLGEPPEFVLSNYLRLRLQITGSLPIVILCGSMPDLLRDPGYWDFLVRQSRYADSMGFQASCAEDETRTTTAIRLSGTRDVIWLYRGIFTRDSSIIEAYALPSQLPRQGVYQQIRNERFAWNHLLDIGGWDLSFRRFQ